MMKRHCSTSKAAYPKGTDAPALYPWRYAGKFSARAGTPTDDDVMLLLKLIFHRQDTQELFEKTAGTGEAGNPLVY